MYNIIKIKKDTKIVVKDGFLLAIIEGGSFYVSDKNLRNQDQAVKSGLYEIYNKKGSRWFGLPLDNLELLNYCGLFINYKQLMGEGIK